MTSRQRYSTSSEIGGLNVRVGEYLPSVLVLIVLFPLETYLNDSTIDKLEWNPLMVDSVWEVFSFSSSSGARWYILKRASAGQGMDKLFVSNVLGHGHFCVSCVPDASEDGLYEARGVEGGVCCFPHGQVLMLVLARALPAKAVEHLGGEKRRIESAS